MKIPVLIPNIFDHPFTYESEINVNKGDYIKYLLENLKKLVWFGIILKDKVKKILN